MDKPRFIRGLLEEVGTTINPITLVKRIPEGLEIEGLREGLKHIMKEHEIQYSISEGVARVLRSEVAAAQNLLRSGQRRGVKFEVDVQGRKHVDVEVKDVPLAKDAAEAVEDIKAEVDDKKHHGHSRKHSHGHHQKTNGAAKKFTPHPAAGAGHCAQCLEPFSEWEMETLVGFACGHVFHLSHLLETLHPGEHIDEDVLLGGAALGGGRATAHYLVGSKVTHARLLKDKITGGCPVCKLHKEEELL